jgi:hypothetical protein
MNTRIQRRAITVMHVGALLTATFFAAAVHAAPVIRQGFGANTAALQAVVDQFRTDLGGPNNGVGGSFAGGRREINWDGVPDSFSEPNNLPADFFNVNSPRGVVFHSALEDSGSALNQFMVSASVASGVPVRFGSVNASYAAQFTTFSAQRLFMPRQAHALQVNFYKPGSDMPATTHGFGVVFTDVEGVSGGQRSVVYVYAPDGRQIAAASAPALNGGLSFVGISFNAGERIGHVIIKAGTDALGAASDGGGNDVVALDDFIYGEPIPLGECSIFKDGFQCPVP